MSRRQSWFAAISALLVAFEIASAVVLVPATTFSISLSQLYDVMSLASVLAVACTAGLLALAYAAVRVAGIGQESSSWSVFNAYARVAGFTGLMFVVAGVITAFGYLGVDDAYPDGFITAQNWQMRLNLLGPVALVVGIVSELIRRVRERAADSVAA